MNTPDMTEAGVAAWYTCGLATLATPERPSDSRRTGQSPDRPGVSSISEPGAEFCMDPATLDRFWSKVNKDGPVHPMLGTPCWLWAAGISKGYGRFYNGNGTVLAHRFLYQIENGPITDGLVPDHLCRVRNCVNPAHLEIVTVRVNTLRGTGPVAVNAAKSRCPRGHEYSKVDKLGHRLCLTCRRLACALARAKVKS